MSDDAGLATAVSGQPQASKVISRARMHASYAYIPRFDGRKRHAVQETRRSTDKEMKGVRSKKKGEIGGKMKNGENGVEVGMWGMGCVDKLGYSG